jgi:hypothetical protein
MHFYNTRDTLPRCQPHDPGEGATCWPAPESTDNLNTKRVGRLGLSDAEEDALVSFMQTLTDGFMPREPQEGRARGSAVKQRKSCDPIAGAEPASARGRGVPENRDQVRAARCEWD